MSIAVLVASSQVRFRLRKPDLIMLNQVNVRFRMVLLHSVTAVFLYTSSFLTIFGHFMFYVQDISCQEPPLECIVGFYGLRRCCCLDFAIVEENRLNICSECFHFCFWSYFFVMEDGFQLVSCCNCEDRSSMSSSVPSMLLRYLHNLYSLLVLFI